MEPFIKMTTGSAGTKDWLEASKNMVVIAYVGDESAMRIAPVPLPTTPTNQPHLFGTHIMEALEAWRTR